MQVPCVCIRSLKHTNKLLLGMKLPYVSWSRVHCVQPQCILLAYGKCKAVLDKLVFNKREALRDFNWPDTITTQKFLRYLFALDLPLPSGLETAVHNLALSLKIICFFSENIIRMSWSKPKQKAPFFSSS